MRGSVRRPALPRKASRFTFACGASPEQAGTACLQYVKRPRFTSPKPKPTKTPRSHALHNSNSSNVKAKNQGFR
jgi:hypothetical protein